MNTFESSASSKASARPCASDSVARAIWRFARDDDDDGCAAQWVPNVAAHGILRVLERKRNGTWAGQMEEEPGAGETRRRQGKAARARLVADDVGLAPLHSKLHRLHDHLAVGEDGLEDHELSFRHIMRGGTFGRVSRSRLG
tara:strand:- start:214 stop:639 length:426 start_codon:yes stop_codon:yes gene_type:complete